VRSPHRDARYLAWIRSLPCMICHTTITCDPHHIVTGGVGQKCSDYWTVPLCRKCHDRVHAEKATWALRMHKAALGCLSEFIAATLQPAVTSITREDTPGCSVHGTQPCECF